MLALNAREIPPQHASEKPRDTRACLVRKIGAARAIVAPRASQGLSNSGCRVAATQGGFAMEAFSLDRLGDEIAELSAHLDAATARLLDLIREFDALVVHVDAPVLADPDQPGQSLLEN